MNSQIAPKPELLFDLIEQLSYKAGWEFTLGDVDRGQGSQGLTLCIKVTGPDTYHPERKRGVLHYMPVPPAAYNEQSWRRWLFEQILLVERHEACEFFVIGVDRPFVLITDLGNDPYLVFELTDERERHTRFDGPVSPNYLALNQSQ